MGEMSDKKYPWPRGNNPAMVKTKWWCEWFWGLSPEELCRYFPISEDEEWGDKQ